MFLASHPVEPGTVLLVGWITVALALILVAAIIFFGVKSVLKARAKRAAEALQPEADAVEEAVSAAPQPTAPGAAGQLKLHDVEPKTAAMLMAIVADKMGKPLNELRFISIKEVK